MNIVTLKQLLAAIYDLEINNYLMQKAINKISSDMKNLGIKREFPEPIFVTPKPIAVGKVKKSKAKEIFAVLGAIVGSVYATYKTSGPEGDAQFQLLETAFSGLLWIPMFTVVGLIIGVIWGCAEEAVARSNAREAADRKHEVALLQARFDYGRRVKAYRQQLQEEDKRVRRELLAKSNLLIDRRELQSKLDQSNQLLNDLYDNVEMLPQFRNIVAVGYMNDLLMIGAASYLKGPNQLYEKVRANLREDNLLNTINGVPYKVDQIIDSRNRMYGALQSIRAEQVTLNSRIEKEAKEIKSTRDANKRAIGVIGNNNLSISTALLEYEAKRIRKELEYQSYIQRMGRY